MSNRFLGVVVVGDLLHGKIWHQPVVKWRKKNTVPEQFLNPIEKSLKEVK